MAGAAGWLLLLLATPGLPAAAGTIVYAFCSAICHQLPARSFRLSGVPLPVCARCLGIYAGAAAGSLAWALVATRFAGQPRPGSSGFDRRAGRSRGLLACAAAPTAATAVAEWAGLWPFDNATRASAGVILGFAAGLVAARQMATLHYGRCQHARPARPPSRRC